MGKPCGFSLGGDGLLSADQQPEWIAAGAWVPLSTNTYINRVDKEYTVGDDTAIKCIRYDKGTDDQWHVVTKPAINWSSGQVKFLVDYIIEDEIGTPGTVVWQLGVEYYNNNFDLDTITYQTISITDNVPDANIPKYRITSESSALAVTGGTSAGSLQLRLKRGNDTESDAVYFVGLRLAFV